MQGLNHCYHLVYDTAGVVVEHAELYFDDLPGSPTSQQWLTTLRRKMPARDYEEYLRRREILATFTQWFAGTEFDDAVTLQGERFRARWQSCEDGTGIMRLDAGRGEPARVNLLLSGLATETPPAQLGAEEIAVAHYSTTLAQLLPGSPLASRADALKLIHLTRRPLLACVTWAPWNIEDSALWTIERMLAYAFFRRFGVMA